MGKYTVSLRQRPRLHLESFEDRALLSAGHKWWTFNPEWLASRLINRALDSRTVEIVSSDVPPSTANTEVNEVEEEMVRVEKQRDSNSNREQNAAPTNNEHEDEETARESDGGLELGENNTGANEGRTDERSTKDNQLGINERLGNDSSREDKAAPVASTEDNADTDLIRDQESRSPSNLNTAELKERLIAILREKLGSKEEPPPSPPQGDRSIPDPVVVRVLEQYGSKPSDASSDRGLEQGNLISPNSSASSEFGSEREATNDTRLAEGEQSQPNASPASPSLNSQREEVRPYRSPAVSQSAEVRGSARENDESGVASSTNQTAASLRAETTALESRSQERFLPGQAVARQAADVAATVRASETTDPRSGSSMQTIGGDYAFAAPHRAETSGSVPTSNVGPAFAAVRSEVALEETPAPVAETPLAAAPLPLGIWDVAVFAPHMSGIIDGMVPFDREAVQAAVQQLLSQVEDLGGEAASWLARLNLSPWVVAVAVGLTACDVVRRKRQQAQRGLVLTDEDGTPLTWFPGLAGVWTMQDA